MLSATLMAGCETVETATNRAAQCAAWRAISYSAKGDTKLTVQQIRVHNEVGRKLGCWK